MANSRSKHRRTIMKHKQRRLRQEKRRKAAAKLAKAEAGTKAPAKKAAKAPAQVMPLRIEPRMPYFWRIKIGSSRTTLSGPFDPVAA